jgi:hypothetical protein
MRNEPACLAYIDGRLWVVTADGVQPLIAPTVLKEMGQTYNAAHHTQRQESDHERGTGPSDR